MKGVPSEPLVHSIMYHSYYGSYISRESIIIVNNNNSKNHNNNRDIKKCCENDKGKWYFDHTPSENP